LPANADHNSLMFIRGLAVQRGIHRIVDVKPLAAGGEYVYALLLAVLMAQVVARTLVTPITASKHSRRPPNPKAK
jgi:hypothetical protein